MQLDQHMSKFLSKKIIKFWRSWVDCLPPPWFSVVVLFGPFFKYASANLDMGRCFGFGNLRRAQATWRAPEFMHIIKELNSWGYQIKSETNWSQTENRKPGSDLVPLWNELRIIGPGLPRCQNIPMIEFLDKKPWADAVNFCCFGLGAAFIKDCRASYMDYLQTKKSFRKLVKFSLKSSN